MANRSRSGGYRPHYLAPPAPWPRRETGRAVLRAIQVHACKEIPAGRPKPLEYRESVALGARRRLRRGRLPNKNQHGPENFATLRRNAVNLIRAYPARISMRQKVKRAGWEDAFLPQLISRMRWPYPEPGSCAWSSRSHMSIAMIVERAGRSVQLDLVASDDLLHFNPQVTVGAPALQMCKHQAGHDR